MPTEETKQPIDLEARLEQMLQPAIDAMALQMQEFIKQQVAPLTGRLEAIEQGSTATEETKAPKDKAESALEARLKLLEQELAQAKELQQQRDKEAASLRFDKSLNDALDGKDVLHKQLVQELLQGRIKNDAVEKDGSWLTKDGKKVSEAVEEFLGSDAGKHFLPSKTKPAGTGTKQPDTSKPATTNAKTLADELMSVKW